MAKVVFAGVDKLITSTGEVAYVDDPRNKKTHKAEGHKNYVSKMLNTFSHYSGSSYNNGAYLTMFASPSTTSATTATLHNGCHEGGMSNGDEFIKIAGHTQSSSGRSNFGTSTAVHFTTFATRTVTGMVCWHQGGASNEDIGLTQQTLSGTSWIGGASYKKSLAWKSQGNFVNYGTATDYRGYINKWACDGTITACYSGYYEPWGNPKNATHVRSYHLYSNGWNSNWGSVGRNYTGANSSNGQTGDAFYHNGYWSNTHSTSDYYNKVMRYNMKHRATHHTFGSFGVAHGSGSTNGDILVMAGGHNKNTYGNWRYAMHVFTGAGISCNVGPVNGGLNSAGSGG